MLPCARTRAGQNFVALQTGYFGPVATAEPLLFLYPRWFQSICRRDRCSRSRSLSTNLGKGTQHPARKSDSRCFGARASTTASKPSSAVRPEYLCQGSSRALHELAAQKLAEDDATEHADGPKWLNVVEHDSDYSTAANLDPWKSPRKSRKGSRVPYSYRSPIDGPRVMSLLSSIKPPTSSPACTEMDVSSLFLKWLLGTAEANMWLDPDKSRCKLVVPQQQQNNALMKLHIQGSVLERQEGMRMIHALQTTYLTSAEQDTERKQVSGIFEDARQVNELPMPARWTLCTFYDYVTLVTNSKQTRSLERTLYAGALSYDKQAARILEGLFSSPELRPCLSLAALRQSLHFLRHRTHLASQTMNIWRHALSSGLVPDVTCFNYELQRAVTTLNWDRVEYLLYTMKQYQIQPDGQTWALMIECATDPTERRRLAKTLFRRKESPLVRYSERKIITRALVKAEFRLALKDGKNLEDFVESMNALHKHFWLSRSVISAMVVECLESKKVKNVQAVLDLAESLDVELTEKNWLSILDAVHRTAHYHDALVLFKIAFDQQDRLLAQSQLELLFKVGWRMKMFNSCYMIWQHAARNGMITYEMQRRVMYNLANNRDPNPVDEVGCLDEREKKYSLQGILAAVVTQIDISPAELTSNFPLLVTQGFRSVAEMLCTWAPSGALRHEQLQLAHFVLERNLNAWQCPDEKETLLSMDGLDRAYELDTRWLKDDFLESALPTEIVEAVIQLDQSSRACKEAEVIVKSGQIANEAEAEMASSVEVPSRSRSESISPFHSLPTSKDTNSTTTTSALKVQHSTSHASSHMTLNSIRNPVTVFAGSLRPCTTTDRAAFASATTTVLPTMLLMPNNTPESIITILLQQIWSVWEIASYSHRV